MQMTDIPFGVTGAATWRTCTFGTLRVRMVEYSPGYEADHWCEKGHILYVLAGELVTELADGRSFTLTPGTSYQVADHAEPHRSRTTTGARLFIVD
ncbi:DHCW motif cupin fold protein [uncultured Deinococcus sp.]|uniref:DHCW motif cupin fold protein n=1 Tax=uncultured Deinococcus sp. TaxID=158789 RepID=UPI0025D5FBD8|nr:DHCW motif cupin fold protein [uncultured Deinococcus sp.]